MWSGIALNVVIMFSVVLPSVVKSSVMALNVVAPKCASAYLQISSVNLTKT
jgi:hypothetical protein